MYGVSMYLKGFGQVRWTSTTTGGHRAEYGVYHPPLLSTFFDFCHFRPDVVQPRYETSHISGNVAKRINDTEMISLSQVIHHHLL